MKLRTLKRRRPTRPHQQRMLAAMNRAVMRHFHPNHRLGGFAAAIAMRPIAPPPAVLQFFAMDALNAPPLSAYLEPEGTPRRAILTGIEDGEAWSDKPQVIEVRCTFDPHFFKEA